MGTKPQGVKVPNEDDRRAEFARRLKQERIERGLNQSELARRTGKILGHDFGRHNISSYESCRAVPGSQNLHAMAKALSVEPTVLMPWLEAERSPADQPMVTRSTRPGHTWLRIDQEVTVAQMVEIARILNPDGD